MDDAPTTLSLILTAARIIDSASARLQELRSAFEEIERVRRDLESITRYLESTICPLDRLEVLSGPLEVTPQARNARHGVHNSDPCTEYLKEFSDQLRLYSASRNLKQLVDELRRWTISLPNDSVINRALNALLNLCFKFISIPWRQRLGISRDLSHSDRVVRPGKGKTKSALRTLKELLRGDISSPRLLNLEPVFGSLRESIPVGECLVRISISQSLRNRKYGSRKMLESMF
jgi:hypothetical protein